MEGFFVVGYVLGLFLLHLTVQFFTPVGVPDIDNDEEFEVELPTSSNQDADHRPLIRSVNEFKLWYLLSLIKGKWQLLQLLLQIF